MNPAVKTSENNYFRPIAGWNKAVLTEIKPKVTTKNGEEQVRTVVYFRLIGASEKSFETISLTNAKDDADVDICNMVLEAFGGRLIKEGEDPSAQLNRCIGKECALLCYPQMDKRDGKTYLHTHFFGFINGQKAVRQLTAVGEVFVYEAKGNETKAVPKEKLSGNDIPF